MDIDIPPLDISDRVLISLRKIIRAVDLQSRQLAVNHQLTGPQLVVLKEISRNRDLTLSRLAQLVSLSKPTVTGIVDRLEQRGLIYRQRSEIDRRQIFVYCTEEGKEKLNTAPPFLQELFTSSFKKMESWEQTQLLASLERIANMINAEDLDAAPLLATHSPEVSAESIQAIPDPSQGAEFESLDMHESMDELSPIQGQDGLILVISSYDEIPDWLSLDELINFFHEYMKPYEDTHEDIRRGIDDGLRPDSPLKGKLFINIGDQKLNGAVLILKTGMKGYIPEHILLFASIHPKLRGQGLGTRLIQEALSHFSGAIKLHVEYDNPARKLYKRLGFNSKYAEMRYYS